MSDTVSLVAEHILNILQSQQLPTPSSSNPNPDQTIVPKPPLFIGLQGPQGIGKTTLTSSLISTLSPSSSSGIRLAILSLDDFYFPHEGLESIKRKHAGNGLYEGRGQAGTHHVEELSRVLHELNRINLPSLDEHEAKERVVKAPLFDKSLVGGKGDRSSEVLEIKGPIDVVILEGWCMGFYPTSAEKIQSLFSFILNETSGSGRAEVEIERSILRGFKVEDVLDVNSHLGVYADKVYPFFTSFVQLSPAPEHPYSLIYQWRLEQEHTMKARNGGRGMTDEQVKLFIDRYIPGYIFFSGGVKCAYGFEEGQERPPPWTGKGLRIRLGAKRNAQGTERF